MSTSYSFELSATQISKLKKHYASYKQSPAPPHAQALFILPDCRITVYDSGKVLFQGTQAAQESALWKTPVSPAHKTFHLTTYIGCDETGVGDYLLPLVVAACYVDPKISADIKQFTVKDSKQLDDAYIRKTALLLQKKVPYAIYSLSNEKYNAFIDNGYNAHAIKAFVHNKAISQLIAACKLPADIDIVMDEFASKKNYQKYLKAISPVYVPTVFETKAENKYIGVAAASMIARAAFLEIRADKKAAYGITFPLGAGSNVDAFGAQFLAQYGETEFQKNVKWHFANTKKIISKRKK